MSFEENSETLEKAVKLLGELANEIVFVGGITAYLYVDTDIANEIRPTRDVDFVIEKEGIPAYVAFQEKLRKKGFTNDYSKEAPICRYKHREDLIIDAMPSDENILGFSNSWYKEGVKNKKKVKIGDKTIYIFPLEYFLASKFEAYNGRGKKDPRYSHDLEDIVIIIDGIKKFEAPNISGRLKDFLSQMAKHCKEGKIQEAMSGFLSGNADKLARLNERLDYFLP